MSLPIPNIVPGCVIKIIDDRGESPRWSSIGEYAYTPRAINDAMRAHQLTSCWVFFLGSREFWSYNASGALAIRARA